MQTENIFVKFVTKQYHDYSSKLKSIISHSTTVDTSDQISETSLKRIYVKLILICLLISIIYLILNRSTTTPPFIPANTNIIQTRQRSKVNAFIITEDCNSLRYKATRENIERAFPKFFTISCYLAISLNDSRIHTSSVLIWKKFSSNLLAFIDLWSYRIPNDSKTNELEWTFIFEDDVNFEDPSKVRLRNYISPLQEIMSNPEVQQKHGFLYLGICGPEFDNDSLPLLSTDTNNRLISQKGYGFCLHATGITAKRSRLFWTEISSYRPNPGDSSLDLQLRGYSIRSKNHYYTLGSNLHYPPGTGHYGIAYQDRGRFSSTIA